MQPGPTRHDSSFPWLSASIRHWEQGARAEAEPRCGAGGRQTGDRHQRAGGVRAVGQRAPLCLPPRAHSTPDTSAHSPILQESGGGEERRWVRGVAGRLWSTAGNKAALVAKRNSGPAIGQQPLHDSHEQVGHTTDTWRTTCQQRTESTRTTATGTRSLCRRSPRDIGRRQCTPRPQAAAELTSVLS